MGEAVLLAINPREENWDRGIFSCFFKRFFSLLLFFFGKGCCVEETAQFQKEKERKKASNLKGKRKWKEGGSSFKEEKQEPVVDRYFFSPLSENACCDLFGIEKKETTLKTEITYGSFYKNRTWEKRRRHGLFSGCSVSIKFLLPFFLG